MWTSNHSSRFIEMFGQISDTTSRHQVKKLSDCCSYISDGSHYSPAEDSSGSYPMLSVKDMTENGFVYSDCKYISKKDFDVLVSNGCQPHLNDVLVAKDGSYFKYSFVVTEDKEQAILSSIAILRPKTDIIDSRYLAYYMLTDAVIQLVEKNYLTGTAIRRVILKGFKEIPTIVPPMALQKSFVAVLEQADKSKFTDFKSRFIELFRDGAYQNVPLGELCSKITDGSHNPPKGVDASEFLMISSQNVFSDGLDLSDVRYLSKEDFENENKRTSVSKGDVLLTIVGTIGRVYLVTGTEGPIALQRSVAVLKPNDKISSRFLMVSFLYDDDFSKEGRGNAQKGVYLKQLSQYKIKLPSIEKQKEFEVIYQQADKSKYLS